MFRTELHTSPAKRPITYADRILTIGSCFADCMGNLLQHNKFTVLKNPFGTVFNPLSILNLLNRGLRDQQVHIDELVEHQGVWSHYDFHSSLSGTDPEQVTKNINERIAEVQYFLKACDVVMLTFGTSFIYSLASTDKTVSNCHKHPGSWFSRRLLTIDEITRGFEEIAGQMPSTHFILTVSPVRHTRDTLPLNKVSKSLLRVASHYLTENKESRDYFPSLEIMHDDLRDYRYYDQDMIHPSPVAEQYIWEKFQQTYFKGEDEVLVKRVEQLNQRIAHRPNHPGTAAHRSFLETLLADLKTMDGRLNFSDEINLVRTRLAQYE